MTTTTQTSLASPQPSARPVRPPKARTFKDHAKKPSNILTIAMIAVVCYFLLPIVWLFIASTKSNSGLFNSFGFAFADDFNLWTNLTDLFTREDGVFLRWLVNTILYAGVSAIGATFLASLAGYAFAKYDFPGRKALFSVVLGAIMVPATALAIPTFLLFSTVGITDTPWAIILPSIVNPFGMYLMLIYAEGAIDDSMLEAGRLDGASEWKIFWRLCSRLLAPGMVTVLLFSLVSTWNNYFLPLIMLNSTDLLPLTVGLSQWQAAATRGNGGEALFSSVLTGSLVSTLPLIVAFLFLQKYWQSGLTAGGSKG